MLTETQQADVGNCSQGLQLVSIEEWGSGPRFGNQVNVQQPMDEVAPDFDGLEVQVGAVSDANTSALETSNPWVKFFSHVMQTGHIMAHVDEQEEMEMRLCWQRFACLPEDQRPSSVKRPSMDSRASTLADVNEIVTRNSAKNRCLKRLDSSIISRLVMAPQSFGRLIWMLFGFLSISFDIVMSPVSLFDLDASVAATYQMIGLVSFVYWLIDFMMQFFTGVAVGTSVDMRPSAIFMAYLKSWFGPDVAMLSVDIYVFVADNEDSMQGSYKGLRAFRALRMLRLMRLLKMGAFIEYLSVLRERFVPDGLLLMVTLFKIWGAFFLVNHYVACAWYALGLSNPGNSWLVDADLLDANFNACYGNALHWSLTQFTPATNNINPKSPEERLFAILVIFLATGCFSSFVGAITTAVNQMRANAAARNEKESCLRTFFRERGLSVFLFMVTQNFFKKQKLYKRITAESQVQILRDIPESLRLVLREEMYKPQLLTVHWLPESCDAGVMGKICVKAFSERCAEPSQDIFLPGTPCDNAYVFSTGSMTYSRNTAAAATAASEDLAGAASYVEAKTFNAANRHPVWVAQPALWTEWKHRGQMTSNDGCVYSCVDCMLLALTTIRHDPAVFRFIRTYGLLLLNRIDIKDSRGDGEPVSDMDLPDDDIQTIIRRTLKFMKCKKVRTSVRSNASSA